MTTFANAFNQTTTMQAPGDAMEVHSDLKNAMVMEEDNLDIDLELGDEPHPNADEDSMMDDDAADGRNEVDADQQMDDDFQENKDQDDEILDFVDENAPVLEIPMVEDAPQQITPLPPNQAEGVFPAIVSNADSIQPLEPSQSQEVSAVNPVAPTVPEALPQVEDVTTTIAKPVTEIPDTYENVESIRTLDDNNDEALQLKPIEAEGNAIAISQGEQTQTQLQETGEGRAEDTNQTAHEGPGNNVSETQDTETAPASAAHASSPGGGSKEAEEVDEEPLQESGEQIDHIEAHEEDDLGERNDTLDPKEAAIETHEVQETSAEPIAVIVTCQGHQMSLFPPYEEHGTPETYLLPDNNLAGKPIRALLDACNGILSDSLSEFEELELHVPSFKLAFREHATEASHYSIRDMSELSYQLHQNDGVDQPEPLHVILNVRTRLSGHIDHLYNLAAEGKGLRFFAESKVTALPIYSEAISSSDELAAQDDSYNSAADPDKVAVEKEEEEEEEDEFGEPDLPQEEPDFEDLEVHQEADNDQDDQGADDIRTNHRLYAKLETSPEVTNIAAEAAVIPEDGEPVVGNPEVQAGDVTDQHDLVDVNDLQENQEDLESYGLESKEEAEGDHDLVLESNQADTNYDSLDADDAQRRTYNANVEPSQSLHSATQPEDTAHETVSPSKDTDLSEAKDGGAGDSNSGDSVPRGALPPSPILKDQDVIEQVHQGQGDDGENFFEDEDYEHFGDADHPEEGGEQETIDIGLEDKPPISPQSLKRSRAVADEAGEDEVDDDEGHQLKKTR